MFETLTTSQLSELHKAFRLKMGKKNVDLKVRSIYQQLTSELLIRSLPKKKILIKYKEAK